MLPPCRAVEIGKTPARKAVGPALTSAVTTLSKALALRCRRCRKCAPRHALHEQALRYSHQPSERLSRDLAVGDSHLGYDKVGGAKAAEPAEVARLLFRSYQVMAWVDAAGVTTKADHVSPLPERHAMTL